MRGSWVVSAALSRPVHFRGQGPNTHFAEPLYVLGQTQAGCHHPRLPEGPQGLCSVLLGAAGRGWGRTDEGRGVTAVLDLHLVL